MVEIVIKDNCNFDFLFMDEVLLWDDDDICLPRIKSILEHKTSTNGRLSGMWFAAHLWNRLNTDFTQELKKFQVEKRWKEMETNNIFLPKT